MVLSSVCRRLGTTIQRLGISLGIPSHRVGSIIERLRELGLVTQSYGEGESWLLPTDSGRRFYRRYLSEGRSLRTSPRFQVKVEMDLRLAIDSTQLLERLKAVTGDPPPAPFYRSTTTQAGETCK